VGERVVNWPNAVTVGRFVIYLPAYYLLLAGKLYCIVIALAIIAAFADGLDGYLARKLGQETEFGRILDPILDKIMIGGTALIVAWKLDGPVWLVTLVIAKDVLIVTGGAVALGKSARAMPSNFWGKLAAGSLVFVFVAFMLKFPPWFLYTAYIASTVIIFASLFSYGWNAAKVLRTGRIE
jgi:CDP-diacylglycerol--glycerol-3-phosphate 3-phosphatidyltransferase